MTVQGKRLDEYHQRAIENAQAENEALAAAWEAEKAARDAEYHQETLEAMIVLYGVEGKNAEERKANLRLALQNEASSEGAQYVHLERVKKAAQEDAAEAKRKAQYASRMYHVNLAMMQLLAAERKSVGALTDG